MSRKVVLVSIVALSKCGAGCLRITVEIRGTRSRMERPIFHSYLLHHAFNSPRRFYFSITNTRKGQK